MTVLRRDLSPMMDSSRRAATRSIEKDLPDWNMASLPNGFFLRVIPFFVLARPVITPAAAVRNCLSD